MTTDHHTAIASGAAADHSTVNSPLAELDSALVQGELFAATSILTISAGVVTLTGAFHTIAAETGTADDLDTITQAVGAKTPQMIVLQADTGDTITLKHNTGNIQTRTSADLTLSGTIALLLFFDGTQWIDIAGGVDAADASCRVYRTTTQAIADSTDVTVQFDNERWDTDTMHDNSTNNTRITLTTAGKYRIIGQVAWDNTDSDGFRLVRILLNGATIIAQKTDLPIASGTAFHQQVETIYEFDAAQYVELEVRQTSGSSQNMAVVANAAPEFMAQLLI
jgi:hypothetical protein